VIQLRREARAAIAWRRGCSVARWTRNGEASFRRAGLVSAGCDARADGVAPAACTKLWPRSAEDLGGARLAASKCSTKRPRTWNGAVGSASDLLPILFVTG
jgi:hypothetical protein